MNAPADSTIRATEEVVTQLVEACRKDGTLYKQNPKAVAQVTRNAKWLLNALGVLQRELSPSGEEAQQSPS